MVLWKRLYPVQSSAQGARCQKEKIEIGSLKFSLSELDAKNVYIRLSRPFDTPSFILDPVYFRKTAVSHTKEKGQLAGRSGLFATGSIFVMSSAMPFLLRESHFFVKR